MLDNGAIWGEAGDAMRSERFRAVEVEDGSSDDAGEPSEGAVAARLTAVGYRIAFRVDGYVECLVVGDGERWLGRGTTPGEAAEDAVAQMLPSRLARALWEAAAARDAGDVAFGATTAETGGPSAAELVAGPDAAEVPGGPAPTAPPDAGPAATGDAEEEGDAADVEEPPAPAAVREVDTTADDPGDAAATGDAPAPTPRRAPAAPSADRAVVVARPSERRSADAAVATIAAAPGPDRGPTLAKLVSLRNRLQRDRTRLAVLEPDELRLEMLCVICEARAFTDLHANDPIVERAVGDVARDLADLGKLWWPGSVRALKLTAAPADIVRDIEPRPTALPKSWGDAATLAARVLAERRQGGARGWADDAECLPPATNAPQLLDAALKVAQDKSASDAALLDAARKLRWLRPAVDEDAAEAWGAAMGRLRQRADRGGMAALRAVLDPRYRPTGNWAREVGQDPAAKQLKKRRAKLLKRIPRADASSEDVAAWLSEAFELGDELPNPKIAECTRHLEALIVGLAEDDLPVDERRHRKRLRSLQLIFDGVEAPDDDEDDDDEDDDLDGDDAGARLLALVRDKVVGQRALLLSNRADPELERQLEDALGIDVTMSLVDTRRRQAASTAVENGSYAMVLAAHRFIGHDVDKDIGQKARAGGIPYVRVGSGRVGSVVRALAREVGVQV